MTQHVEGGPTLVTRIDQIIGWAKEGRLDLVRGALQDLRRDLREQEPQPAAGTLREPPPGEPWDSRCPFCGQNLAVKRPDLPRGWSCPHCHHDDPPQSAPAPLDYARDRCAATEENHGVDRRCILASGHAGDHEAHGSASKITWAQQRAAAPEHSEDDGARKALSDLCAKYGAEARDAETGAWLWSRTDHACKECCTEFYGAEHPVGHAMVREGFRCAYHAGIAALRASGAPTQEVE